MPEPARSAHHWSNALPWCVKAAEVLVARGFGERARAWLEEVLNVAESQSNLYQQTKGLLQTIKSIA